MNKYFELLHKVADANKKEYADLKDLTIAVAMSGGYRREEVTLKNGKKVMRTRYNVPSTWDNSLVAKWLCRFEKLFKSKLGPHPELREFYPDIIQRTFTIYFNALQIDKLSKSGTLSTTVYMCLNNRIGEAFISKGSKERLLRYDSYSPSTIRKSADRVVVRSIINYISESLDSSPTLYKNIVDEKCVQSDLMLDISTRLSGNPFGQRLLDAMTNSYNCDFKGNATPINFCNIRDYMYLSDKELSDPATIGYIKSAYRVIINTLKEYYPNYDYDSLKTKSFKLNKISKNVQELCM